MPSHSDSITLYGDIQWRNGYFVGTMVGFSIGVVLSSIVLTRLPRFAS